MGRGKQFYFSILLNLLFFILVLFIYFLFGSLSIYFSFPSEALWRRIIRPRHMAHGPKGALVRVGYR